MREELPEDSEIAAVLPEYTERGDSTRILLRDGREILIDCTTNTLAQVNVALAVRLVTEPRCAIETAGGQRVPVLWSRKTIQSHIAEGCHIHADLLQAQQKSVLRRLARKDDRSFL